MSQSSDGCSSNRCPVSVHNVTFRVPVSVVSNKVPTGVQLFLLKTLFNISNSGKIPSLGKHVTKENYSWTLTNIKWKFVRAFGIHPDPFFNDEISVVQPQKRSVLCLFLTYSIHTTSNQVKKTKNNDRKQKDELHTKVSNRPRFDSWRAR